MRTPTFARTLFQKVVKLNLALANTSKVIWATFNNTLVKKVFCFFCTNFSGYTTVKLIHLYCTVGDISF